MTSETAERRILGALRFVSAVNGLPLSGPVRVTAVPSGGAGTGNPPASPEMRVQANGRGLHILHAAPGFADYAGRIEPPVVDDRDFRLRAFDLSGLYLPAEFVVRLPRSLDSTRTGGRYAATSVFEPISIPLLPSPAAPVADNWAVVRALVFEEAPDPANPGQFLTRAVPGALVRVHAEEAPPRRLLGRGLSEWRNWVGAGPGTPPVAEALVAIAGIPAATWSDEPDGAVLTVNQSVRFELRIDRQFQPAVPGAVPDLSRLEPAGGGALPAGVVAAELPAARVLRVGLRETLSLLFTRLGQLATP